MHDSQRPKSATIRRTHISKSDSLKPDTANSRSRTQADNDAIRRVIASHADRVDYTTLAKRGN